MNTLVVGALVVVAALLRLPSLGNALFGDELSSYFIVTHHGLGGIVRLLDGHSVDLTPPLYFLLSRLVVHLGDTALALRIVPWIAVLAAIPLSYVVGARTIGRRGALIGAALLALSPFLIFYGTEARAYGLVMALVLGSTACLLIALERGGAGWWLGYAVLACAAMYTHYTAVFALAAQFVWAFFAQPGARLPLVLASLAAAAGFAPWLPVLVKNSHSFGTAVFAILEPFHLSAVAHDIGHWSVGHPYLPLSTVPGRIGLALAAGGVLVAICSLAENAAVPDRLRVAGWLRSPAILPLLLAVATPVGLALYSWLHRDTWDMRNLISSSPGLALAMGALLGAPARHGRLVATGLVLIGFAVGAGELLVPAHERPDYTAAARYVERTGARSDPVAVISAPTPGPLSAMDAAFTYTGERGRPLLRIGTPTLSATLSAPPYALLPAPPATALAAQAARVKAGGQLFVVAPGTVSAQALLRSAPIDPIRALGPAFGSGTSGALFARVFTPLSAFMRALSPDFALAGTRRFQGMLPLSVYVFTRR